MMRRHFRLACGLLCTLLASFPSFAADPKEGDPPSNGVTVGRSQKNDVSPPLREVPVKPLVLRPQHLQREPLAHISEPREASDPVVQKSLAPPAMPGTTLNFDGIGFPGVACNCLPPDTNGEVGATQYVQMVNEGIQVFDKTTGASVLGPVSIVTLWSGFGGACENFGDGDPVVVYDQLADRWIVSQFAGSSVPTDECVAVSTTSDATGSWYRYAFHLGSNYFDYPKLSVWPDAYYLAENVFNAAGTAYLGPQPFALDRAAMLAGNPASFITPGLKSISLGFMLSADLDGLNPPPAGAPNPWLSTEGATWALYRFHVDWVTPANSTFTLGGNLSPAGFTSLCPVTASCVPQAGTTAKLDGIGDRPMFRLAYRHFGDGHEALVGNRTVDSGGVAGIRWWEIDNATSGAPGFVQEGTYQPDATWRWMGSVAMDTQGNLALGFSASSASIHPQIRYAGRLSGDPAGTLAQGEAALFAGTGSQTSNSNRWGDYSDLTVDPVDDCTFWYTSEYYATTSVFNWRTRIGNFKFPLCTAGPPIAVSLQVDGHPTAAPTALGLNKVFEPGETVLVAPGYFNGLSSALLLTGTASNFKGPGGASYTLVDGAANYGSIGPLASANCFDATADCYVMGVDHPALRPAAHWDSTFDELLSIGTARTWTLHIGESFTDTLNSHSFYSFIETIFHNGITSGCGTGTTYCPDSNVTRAQMAVFLLRAEHGSGYIPPPCTGIFTDVECTPTKAFAVDFIERLKNEGITSGCGAGTTYCPDANVTRAEMAVFLLRAKNGSGYIPPPCTGIFTDVECTPTPAFAVDFIEELKNEGITSGCQLSPLLYCPSSPATRGQMALFLTRTFGLLLYGP